MFSEEKLAEIRERISISDLVSEYVQLKKAGKSLKGLCPFHQEKTPSFVVSPERETFHCFGCSTGGNLFHFLMKIENLSFPEAVHKLADRAGVAIEKAGPIDPALLEKRERAFGIQRHTAWYYHCLLKKTPKEDPVWAYLQKRQISSEMVEAFHIGYCPPQDSGLRKHLKNKGFTTKEIEESSLYRGDREFFRGRLLFPIFRADKKVVGLGGRIMGDKEFGPKYLNSPESEIFKKGELFYGLDKAKQTIRQKNQAIVSEGYLDVITLHSHGFIQAIAPLGTAFTFNHARTLRRLCEDIILLFDGDHAGEEASLRALEVLLGQGVSPFWVALESGEDPDSFLKRFGRLAFEKKLGSKRNLLEELIDKKAASVPRGQGHLEEKGQAARQILALIDKIPDSIVKNLYQRRLAEAFEIPEDWLKGLPRAPLRGEERPKAKAPRVEWLPEEEIIIEVWLKFPELREEILKNISLEDFCSEAASKVVLPFWQLAEKELLGPTGKYFDLAPSGFLEVLSELAMRADGLDEINTARSSLEDAVMRLKEKHLRQDLQAFKDFKNVEHLDLIQEKILALSQVIKNKERVYGERKS